MKKLMITYRATIDRYVPIIVRAPRTKQRATRSKFFLVRERIRLMS